MDNRLQNDELYIENYPNDSLEQHPAQQMNNFQKSPTKTNSPSWIVIARKDTFI